MANLSPINSSAPGRVRVGIKRTINLGDYNSISYDLSLEEEVRPDSSRGEAIAMMFDKVTAELGQRLKKDGHIS